MKRFLLASILILFLASCGTLPCKVQAKDYLSKVNDILNKWMNAEQVASSTSQIALSDQIANLQSIRREAEALEPPDCARAVQNNLVNAMNYSIAGYLYLMSNKPDNIVNDYFDTAKKDMSNLSNEIASINR